MAAHENETQKREAAPHPGAHLRELLLESQLLGSLLAFHAMSSEEKLQLIKEQAKHARRLVDRFELDERGEARGRVRAALTKIYFLTIMEDSFLEFKRKQLEERE